MLATLSKRLSVTLAVCDIELLSISPESERALSLKIIVSLILPASNVAVFLCSQLFKILRNNLSLSNDLSKPSLPLTVQMAE
jgi:hypothetical protein